MVVDTGKSAGQAASLPTFSGVFRALHHSRHFEEFVWPISDYQRGGTSLGLKQRHFDLLFTVYFRV